jgi:hypothetical protein
MLKTNVCTSCLDGFTLMGQKCMSNYVVSFTYQVDIPYATFLSDSTSQQLLTTIATALNVTISNVILNSLTSGSTVVRGSVSTGSPALAARLSEIAATATLSGYTVLSRSASVGYIGPSPTPSN